MTTLKVILNNPLRTPWMDSVRATGQLTVFLDSSLNQSSWGPVFKAALAEFNQISATNNLGVTMVESTVPPANDGRGSNVQVEVPTGQPSFTLFGDTHTHDEPFDPRGLHGLTLPPSGFIKGFKVIFKAFVFVPGMPSFSKRLVGDPVKRHIAIHELVHVCGLSNLAHTKQSEPDPGVFLNFPGTFEGLSPDLDRIKLKSAEFANGKQIKPPILSPPIQLHPTTIQLIQENWQK